MPDEKRQAPRPAGGKVELSTMSQTKENWWDKAKPYVEITGVVLLAIYTGYTIKMYYANRTSADAAVLPLAQQTLQEKHLNRQISRSRLSNEPTSIPLPQS
jgi:hypothetical protein